MRMHLKTPLHPLPGLLCLLCSLCIAVTVPFDAARSQALPSMGDPASGVISPSEEKKIGQALLRQLRASSATLEDPLLKNHVEHLLYRLVTSSELKERQLSLVIIRSPDLNAAVFPGSVVMVSDGLFFHADTEQLLAAILAHELAHLSQRHFARMFTSQKKSQAISTVGLLAGLALMATGGTDAGLAAITSSQSYGQHGQLKYNRELEEEADRIGITTLAESDMDPYAMAYVFEQLQESTRYSAANRIPEFLRTHPVTRARIADAYNQSSKYPKQTYPLSLDYQLMRARAKAITSDDLTLGRRFEAGMKDDDPVQQTANKYGLALTLTNDYKFEAARQNVKELRDAHPYNTAFRIAEIDTYLMASQPGQAIALLEDALALNPDNYPLSMQYAKAFIAARRPADAISVLKPLSIARPSDDQVWYMLAESYGLASNIIGVHEARAEYFVLNGDFEQAIKQLGYALPMVEDSFQLTARIERRLAEIEAMEEGL
ncbi:MAG: M48 family metalloprotease [Pseudomonadales bacterium]